MRRHARVPVCWLRIASGVVGSVVCLAGCGPAAEEAAPAPSAATEWASPAPVVDTARAVAASASGSWGQTVYVPSYSHIYYQDGTREFGLTTTLSIRNTDPVFPVTVTRVQYNASSGRPLRQYAEAALRLPPLASHAVVVDERDTAGGVGAHFLVEWRADRPVSVPLVEAVMIGTAGTQGLSFVSRGQVVRPLESGQAEAR